MELAVAAATIVLALALGLAGSRATLWAVLAVMTSSARPGASASGLVRLHLRDECATTACVARGPTYSTGSNGRELPKFSWRMPDLRVDDRGPNGRRQVISACTPSPGTRGDVQRHDGVIELRVVTNNQSDVLTTR